MVPNNSRQRNAPRPSVPVHAPYNFVPFSEKILFRYAGIEELPPHDRIDPALHTGEIHATLRAETPVFVSDGDEEPHFFRGPDGKYQIPGSTVRGMVRENMQILGYGLVRPGEDLDDEQIFFRLVGEAKKNSMKQLETYYKKMLHVKSAPNRRGKAVSTPHAVKAGYLHREKNHYWIQPVKGDVLRVSRNHPGVKQFGTGDARTIEVSYISTGDSVKSIYPGGRPGMKQGILLFTGRPVQKANCLYLFPEEDHQAPRIHVTKEEILAYQVDWEGRKNTLSKSAAFWELPNDGKSKPVFFARCHGQLYFGMSRFLRIGYRNSLSKGLPQEQQEAAGSSWVDYPSAILGFSRGKQAFRSRVSFGGFYVQGKPKLLSPVAVMLSQPKPSYFPAYVVDGKHYNEEQFRLRGYKLYWLKAEPQIATQLPSKNTKMISTIQPFAEGSEFQGIIRYKNLTDDELGLLLLSLRIGDGCYQSVGMGKPLGFGRMTLTINHLREIDFNTLYTMDSFGKDVYQEEKERIDQLIATYEAYAESKLEIPASSYRNQPLIQDFLFIKSFLCDGEKYSYMNLSDYRDAVGALSDLASIRKAESTSEPASVEKLAQLVEQFGRK